MSKCAYTAIPVVTFYSYCMSPKRRPRRKGVNTASADFIDEVRKDDTFPQKATTWSEIDDYLSSLHACVEAFDAGAKVFKHYKRHVSACSLSQG